MIFFGIMIKKGKYDKVVNSKIPTLSSLSSYFDEDNIMIIIMI